MIIVLLIAIIIFMFYLLKSSLKRINLYENFFSKLYELINYSTEKMKLVDASGHYESDDETGFFFDQLKELQLMLDSLFQKEDEEKKVG